VHDIEYDYFVISMPNAYSFNARYIWFYWFVLSFL